MKKFTILFAMLALTVSVIAQNRVAIKSNVVVAADMRADKAVDTLLPASIADTSCGNHLTYYYGAGMGYVTGTNSYGDLEKAQRYNATGSITGVMGFVASSTPITPVIEPVALYLWAFSRSP
jgi:hypothetical protein